MTHLTLVAAASLLAAGAAATADAQSLTYSRGQNVSPAYEGWEEDADGRKYFVFGYMNRNWEEEIVVPVGPDNSLSPGEPDQGQPTRFLPRRNRFIFRVPVPAGFTEKDELVWTLTTKGKTEKAYASLRMDYKMDDVVRASETGALGAGSSSPEVRANRPPVLEIQGRKAIEARVGQPIVLTAIVTDDGIPKRRAFGGAGAAVSNVGSSAQLAAASAATEGGAAAGGAATTASGGATSGGAASSSGGASSGPPAADVATRQLLARLMRPPSRITVGKQVGLHVGWHVYRGAGRVTFSPDQTQTWEDTRTGGNSPWAPFWTPPPLGPDGRTEVTVTFHDPGVYVLRARADDGALTADREVTVTVKP
ncbi:MAG: hypothetical protein AB1635_13295 [Acidobacteriota bacterium]